ncbi:MAG: M23 family metallopeptidase [Sphingomonadales bacterium]|nr:M23 family metallopeptidase [Sphingomonadales bacterium]MDE2172181.1 M23 family metallopeptidase [Sphingomonadales bacterium]
MSRRAALGGMVSMMIARDALAQGAGHGAIRLSGRREQGGWFTGRVPTGTRRLGYLPDALASGMVPVLDAPNVEAVPLAPDGRFFIGIDRDSPLQGLLIMDQGAARIQPVAIAPRAWPIEHIDVPFHPPAVPDEDFARIRAGEIARIKAARAQVTGATGWAQSFIWPAHGRISGRFGSQRIYRGTPGAYHSGLDIAPGAGATYVAPADGVVVLAADAPFTLEGNLLILDHGMGLNSAFLHAERLLVREGDRVSQGQPLGLVGMTGRATGPHLHWSLCWQAARLDPLLILPSTDRAA